MPRKQGTLTRITLRIDKKLADGMNKVCEREDLTQRDFIEQAVREYCAGPAQGEAAPQKNEGVYRTGMWIDPQIVRMMDEREQRENIFQRTLLERAVRAALRKRDVRV